MTGLAGPAGAQAGTIGRLVRITGWIGRQVGLAGLSGSQAGLAGLSGSQAGLAGVAGIQAIASFCALLAGAGRRGQRAEGLLPYALIFPGPGGTGLHPLPPPTPY